jgi:peptide-methionine (S)-S-oxide reductase
VEVARESIAYLVSEKIWDDAIVTQVVPAETFYPAEDYHQEFFKRNPHQGYCMAVVSPKVSKFRKNFKELLRG